MSELFFFLRFLTFKILHGVARDYVINLIDAYQPPSRQLRTSKKKLLVIPFVSYACSVDKEPFLLPFPFYATNYSFDSRQLSFKKAISFRKRFSS